MKRFIFPAVVICLLVVPIQGAIADDGWCECHHTATYQSAVLTHPGASECTGWVMYAVIGDETNTCQNAVMNVAIYSVEEPVCIMTDPLALVYNLTVTEEDGCLYIHVTPSAEAADQWTMNLFDAGSWEVFPAVWNGVTGTYAEPAEWGPLAETTNCEPLVPAIWRPQQEVRANNLRCDGKTFPIHATTSPEGEHF